MPSFKHYALVGFANSGKSTLFNLLSGEKLGSVLEPVFVNFWYFLELKLIK